MEKVNLICDLIVAVCGIIPTLISVFLLIKNTIAERNWKTVEVIAKAAMTATEDYSIEHPNMTSKDKLDMALASVQAGLTSVGIACNEELIKKVIAYIEEMCKWSKTVNH